MSLWVTPICLLFFLAVAWLLSLILPVPGFVYWIIIIVLTLTWLGDLINVIKLRRDAGNGGA